MWVMLSGRSSDLSCYACNDGNMLNWRPCSPYYLSGVHIHRIIYANTRKRDFEKHAKTGEFHSSMRASELTAPPATRRNTNYQLRMA